MKLTRYIIQKVQGLTEPGMRVSSAFELLNSADPAELAYALQELIVGCINGDSSSREVILTLVELLYLKEDELYSIIAAVYREAKGFDLEGTATFLLNPAPRLVKKFEAEAITQNSSLGARRAKVLLIRKRAEFEKFLHDLSPEVVFRLLRNPNMTEARVILIASRRPNDVLILREIILCSKWLTRIEVRKALIYNPYGATGVSIKLLATMTAGELHRVFHTGTLHPAIHLACEVFLGLHLLNHNTNRF